MRYAIILFVLLLFTPIVHAQTNLDELLAPIDFLEERDEETPKDQQYTLEITQLETQQGMIAPSLTTQEQASFDEYGYVVRRIDDETSKPASLHFSLDTTRKSFDLVPGVRSNISPTTIRVTTSDSTGFQLVAKLNQELQTAAGQKIPLVQEDAYGWGYTLDETRLRLTVFPGTDQPLGAYNATIQVISLPW
jgi:hypothetical protein